MAVVPISQGQSVESRPTTFVPQTGGDNPASFGAGSAAALGALGKSVSEVGDETAKVAQDMAIQDASRAAKDAHTAMVRQVDDLGWKGDGTPQNPGYYNLKGQAAINAQPGYEAAIAALRTGAIDGLKDNHRAVNMLRNTVDAQAEQERLTSMRFIGRERNVADTNTNNARASLANDQMTRWWNDPVKMEEQARIIRGSVADNGRIAGDSPETIEADTKKALSTGYGQAVRSALAAGDLGAVQSLFDKFSPQMDATHRVALAEHIKYPLQNALAAREVDAELGPAMGGTIGPGGTSDGIDTREQQRLLDTISGPESRGRYNVRYTPSGGTAFDGYDKHPNVREPTKDGRTSDAAGRYQFLSSTYNPIAQRLGLTDFSPRSQNKAAWELARSTYEEKTNGGDLQTDLAAGGNAAKVADALKGQWPSMPGGTQQGISTDRFAAGLSGVERSASSGAAAMLADQTRVHPDFSAAADRLVAKYPNDPEMQQKLLAQLGSRQSAYNLGIKTQKEGLTKSLVDTEAKLRDGIDAEVPELAIRHVFDPPIADAMVGKLNEARDFGQVYKGVQFMPADGYASTRAALAAGQGAKAAMSKLQGKAVVSGSADESIPGEGSYVQQQKNLAVFDAAWTQRQTQIKADPAAYARNEPNVAAAYAAVNPKDPATLIRAIDLSHSTQRGLGVADSDVRTLGAAEVGGLVKTLHSVDPEKGDMGKQLDQMSQQYGTAWPGVIKDLVVHGKLDPAYQVLAAMDQPAQLGARQNLQRALQDKFAKSDKFGSGIARAQKTAMDDQIMSSMSEFRTTIGAGGEGLMTGVVMPAVHALATLYAERTGDGAKAATDAYEQIVTMKYDISGTLRAPKTYNGKPLGASAVLDAGRTVTGGLKAEDLAPTSATLRQARNGSWFTNQDGAGATLMAPSVAGGFLPVRRADGRTVSMDFAALPKAAASEPVAPTIGGLF